MWWPFRRQVKSEPLAGKVIIAGLGRSGTSFLMQLLTLCGLDTGFDKKSIHAKGKWSQDTRSGLETNVELRNSGWKEQNLPQVIKNPLLSQQLETLIQQGMQISHVFVPVRRLDHVIKSRYESKLLEWLEKDASLKMPFNATWDFFFLKVLGKLSHDLVIHNIPHTYLRFPDLVENPEYLWDKLGCLHTLMKVSKKQFITLFNGLAFERA